MVVCLLDRTGKLRLHVQNRYRTLNVAFVRRMSDVSLCWVVFDMFVRKCIRYDTCVYSVGLGTLSVVCKVT